MRRALLCLTLGAVALVGCTRKSSCIDAAAPHLDHFAELKLRALDLLELRTSVERRRLLANAMAGDEESLSPGLRALLRRMREEHVTITAEEVAKGEASFWRLLDFMFSENDQVLQGELVFIEQDRSTTVFRYPREREVPAGLRWYGLREPRTFCATAECLVDDGVEPCVLLQIRPRDYPGSAGLTVGYEREP